MPTTPSPTRYDKMIYNRSGRSGLKLPAISLGLVAQFRFRQVPDSMRAICHQAFDLGVTHFDLANNYGPPPARPNSPFGDILRGDFRSFRDELVISTKAGYNMWPGPYGEWGSRKSLLASLDQSLKRMGINSSTSSTLTVSIPRPHSKRPWARSITQFARARRFTSAFPPKFRRTKEAVAILKQLGTPCLIHQPSYSMINRWIEDDRLLDTLEAEGVGAIVFSPLAQGLLTDKYLDGVPTGSRATISHFFNRALLRRKISSAHGTRRHRQAEGPNARSDGACLDVERQARDVGPDRREQPRASDRQRQSARQPVFHRR